MLHNLYTVNVNVKIQRLFPYVIEKLINFYLPPLSIKMSLMAVSPKKEEKKPQ